MTKVGTPNEGERYYNSGNATRGSEKKKLLSSESFEGTYQTIQRGRVYNFSNSRFPPNPYRPRQSIEKSTKSKTGQLASNTGIM
jgi:hypothetical protein